MGRGAGKVGGDGEKKLDFGAGGGEDWGDISVRKDMNMDLEKKSPVENEAPKTVGTEAQVPGDVQEFMEGVQKYGKPFVAALVIALLVVFFAQTMRNRKAQQADADSTALFQAQTPEELRQLSQAMKGDTAALALSMAASQLESQERYDEAIAAYQDFLTRFPGHELAAGASFGVASCLEGQGEYDAAAAAYGEWAAAHPGAEQATQAVLAQVRCLTKLGAFDQARVALEDLEAGSEDAGVGLRVTQAKAFLEKARRAAEKAAAAPVDAVAEEAAPVVEVAEEAVEAVAEPVAEVAEAVAEVAEEAAAEPEVAAVEEAPAEEPAAADEGEQKAKKSKKKSKKSKKAEEEAVPEEAAAE